MVGKELATIKIRKYHKHSDSLAPTTTAIAILADEIWREHYTPIIGAAQVFYMLEKFQSAEQIWADIRSNGYTYFTATQIKHNKPIGYAACQPKEDYLLLSKIYVHKDYRGEGVARSFLEEATALCREGYGFDKIRLTVNKHNDNSIVAYHKMGFKTVASVKTDIGEGYFMDDYVMELRVG